MHCVRRLPSPLSTSTSSLRIRGHSTGRPLSTDPRRLLLVASPLLLGAGAVYLVVSHLPERTRPLSSRSFAPALLESSQSTGPDTRLLTLALPPHILGPPPGAVPPIWSIYVKDSDIQVERPYTPLHGSVDEHGRMVLWVKSYADGEVGRWLCERRVGETVEVRGPVRTWAWEEGKWDDVVMISGGTGITPFLQLFHTVISRPSPPSTHKPTRFTLLHSSRTPAHLPPPEHVAALRAYASAHPDRFRFRVFVDQRDLEHLPASAPDEVRRIAKEDLQKALEDWETVRKTNVQRWWWGQGEGTNVQEESVKDKKPVLFLVCGPQPMIAALAGPMGRNLSQGRVGGMLGEMGYGEREVWKL